MASAEAKILPRHVAITMDGNGRWAAARGQSRAAGHKAGLDPVRMCIEECSQRNIEALTLFAFSSENWARPAAEVGSLMGLFVEALEAEITELQQRNVRGALHRRARPAAGAPAVAHGGGRGAHRWQHRA